ncbi:MAG: hypothetical protein QFB86_01625 [Patescibacteria group bacterium]|nr:hypothetical protein [Patescibacteria group bacterium]
MKKSLRGLCSLLVLAFALMLFAPSLAYAAEGFNVITSPLPIKINTSPGKTIETELRIKNQGTLAEGIKVGLMKFKGNSKTGKADLLDLSKQDQYASWVHFTPNQFLAQPGVWNTVKMRIDVPETASLGYYLAVTFSPASVPGGRNVTTLKGSAATLVLLDVKGANEKRVISIDDFTANHKVYEYLPATFDVKVKNSGNIYIAPAGNIFITKGSKHVDTLDFNLIGGSVLPNSTRSFAVPWKNGFPSFHDRLVNGKPVADKKGFYVQDLKYNFGDANKFRFGKYTAKLLVAYDDGQRDVPLESTVTFWVIPWKLMLGGLAILTLVGFGLYSALRGTFRSAKQKTAKRRNG